MKQQRLFLTIAFLWFAVVTGAKEYHVSTHGNDSNNGCEKQPFRTIQKAVQFAYPGDIITVHAGVYRERIDPLRGGTDEDNRIIYRAAAGERVEIKGSEKITGWVKDKEGIWKAVIPDSFFGNYNPYTDLIEGDWFYDHGRKHHTGEVFLNNKSFYEVDSLEKIYNPKPDKRDPEGSKYTWYCESDGSNTTIWANFQKYNPNKELTEITVRNTCFYPSKQGVNYITISGFHFSQAATQWAAPTAEQVGMIATHWNKGWIIENNVIRNSKCSGITLGKEKSTGHNVWSHDRSLDGSLHYIEVTFNTLRHGWNKENIGSHIVRNNSISDCGQTGICGSMGAAFSIIENNHIYNIWTKRQYSGAEIAGIKFHAAIDTKITNNHIHGAHKGLWLDWMTQGTHVSKNVLYDNDNQDLFVEVSHGPYLVANNFFGSPVSLWDASQGGAYIHNFFAGRIYIIPDVSRYTPYHLPHSTDVAGLSIVPGGDNRFYNNLFMPAHPEKDKKYGLVEYAEKVLYPVYAAGNVYYNGAQPMKDEKNLILLEGFDPEVTIETKKDGVYVSFLLQGMRDIHTELITTEKLGRSRLAKQLYENTDSSPVKIDTDIFDTARSLNPKPGPFESLKDGRQTIRIVSNLRQD